MKTFKKIGKQSEAAKKLPSKIAKKPLRKPNQTIKEKEEDILKLQEELERKLAAKSFEDFVNEDLDTGDESSIGSLMNDSDEAEFTGGESEEIDEEQTSTKRSKEFERKKSKVNHDCNAGKQPSTTENKKSNKTASNSKTKPKHVEEFDDLDFGSSGTDEEEPLHTLPDTLELASDDSDFEDLEDSIPARPINTLSLAQIDQWHEDLQNDKTTKTVRQVMIALNSALASLHSEESKKEIRIEGSNAFNAIVRLCLVRMLPSFKSLLKISPQEKRIEPMKSKNWAKVKTSIRQYLLSVVKLLNGVYSEHLLSVVLKHIHQAMPFFACIEKTVKFLCKKLFSLWSSGEESVRVLAFMCLLKLCTLNSQEYLESVMKGMYLSYVKNTKFTAPKTLPGINFMRRSLVEIFALDDRLAYRHGFLYIRQLAIHLRNAMTTKKKDSLQVVYNWQFVHSLNLWASIIGILHDSVNMRQLIYPLVQVIIGTINLMATAKYYPLRFHCAKILTQLSSQTKTFIPVLPFYADILQNHNFNRKLENNTSGKAVDLSCILKVSTSQLKEESYRDSVVEQIQCGICEYASICSNSITFPETIFPLVMQIKTFMKKFSNGTYNKKMKVLIEKLMENSKFIEDKRKTVTFGIADTESIQAWETQLRLNGTPFMKFYTAWRKEHDREEIRKANKPEEVNFDQIPTLKKRVRKDIEDENKEFEGLFPSGDEESDDDEERFMLKEERGKGVKRPIEKEDKPVKEPKKVKGGDRNEKQQKKAPLLEDLDAADEVEDLHLSDLESEEEVTGFDTSYHRTSDNGDSDE